MRARLSALAAVLLIAAGCGGKKKPVTAVARPVGWRETGVASWYGDPYHGRRAANGEIFDMEKLTAAHRTLPFGTWLRVERPDNGRSVVVRVTDRGPFVGKRIIDLSRAAAREIEMIGPGLAQVRIEVIRPPAPPSLVEAAGHSSPVIVAVGSPPPPLEEAEPAPPAASLDLFAVQVGVFSDRARAERLRERLEQRYGAAMLVERDASRVLWRVLVGREETEPGAAALAERIRSEGEFSGVFVVRLDESAEKPAQNALPLGPKLEEKPRQR